jgi:iron complex transport system ATP-binding protein
MSGGPPSSSAASPMLAIRDLRVRLGRVQAVDGVDLALGTGEWLAVVGPNGAGKSTLLRAVAGLVRFTGSIRIEGQDAAALAPRNRARLIGYAPQVPVLPEALTVREYVLLGRTPYHSLIGGPREADREVTARALTRLDLADLADRPLRELSGGRQRAVLARALAQEPRLILLDEPTSSLDLGHAQQVLELVDGLRRDEGLTVLSTLHDLVLAAGYADRLALLARGHVVAAGTPAEVLTPQSLAEHYGATAEVVQGPDGPRIFPVRRG